MQSNLYNYLKYKSVTKYLANFIYYSNNIRQNNKALLDIYQRGLKEEIKNKIIYYEYCIDVEDKVNLFHRFIDMAIKLED